MLLLPYRPAWPCLCDRGLSTCLPTALPHQTPPAARREIVLPQSASVCLPLVLIQISTRLYPTMDATGCLMVQAAWVQDGCFFHRVEIRSASRDEVSVS